MPLFQSNAARGLTPTPTAYQAGIVTTAIFEHTFTANFTAATDKLEIGVLPANVRIVGATLVSGALGAITADVGLMSGDAGEADADRTVGNQIFNDASVNSTAVDATLAACLAIAPSDKHRGIGVTLSGNVTAGSTKTLTLRIDYIA